MELAHGDLIRVDFDYSIVVRKDAPRQGKVGVISGGGSGHEPMHGGYVGRGMLDAACPGARAEGVASLIWVAGSCRQVNEQGRSMGMALTPATVPAAGKPTFELGDDEMEIGIGIHGEPGRRRAKVAPAADITEMLTTP